MITIEKTQLNSFTNRLNASFAGRAQDNNQQLNPVDAYFTINRDVYENYVKGDISLFTLLKNKLSNFWQIVTQQDPALELKAKMIEESLKNSARKTLALDCVV